MTNPSPRPLCEGRGRGRCTRSPTPRARATRAPKPRCPAPADPAVGPGPRTIADTNRQRERRAVRRPQGEGEAGSSPRRAAEWPRKKHKFSGSTSNHLRVPDTEFVEHPKPKGERKRPAS